MMDILQDIKSLKDQGVSDNEVIELLVLKGRKKEQINEYLKVYYLNYHSTEFIQQENQNKSTILIVICVVLAIIAGILGWFIYSG